MAKIELEKKAKTWLKNQIKSSNLVFAKKEIDSEIFRYLKAQKLYGEINRQYIFLKSEASLADNTFEENFWLITLQYLDLIFDKAWYFTGHYAFTFSFDNFSQLQKQITVSTKNKSNKSFTLPNGMAVLASYDKAFEQKPLIQKIYFDQKIFIQKPEYLIIKSTLNEYQNYSSEIVSILKSSERDEKFFIDYFMKNNSEVLLARLIGALREIEDLTLRLELEEIYKLGEQKVSIKNPFKKLTLPESVERPAYLNRLEISMLKAIETLKNLKKPSKSRRQFSAKDLEKIAIEDTYHSLTIEGYTVTRALIQYLEDANTDSGSSVELRSQLAAKGFMNAISYIKKIIAAKFKVTEQLARKLYEELWKPSFNAGLVKADLDIYRKHMVSIKGSLYVPPSHEKVPLMLDEVFDFARQIDNGYDLAIFLHYFYVSVHPHPDGNGRISRFLMNLALVADKYSWITIPSEKRGQYFKSLEKSQVEDDISYFAKFILEL